MASDTLDLADFYESRSGEVARHLIRRQIRALWPSVRGDAILGLGYSMPYLRQFRNEAERLLAVVPPGQGMLPQWPAPVACATCLAAEEALPFPNDAFDRILLVHCLEHSRQLDDLLREVWRTLKGEGLLLVVAPNRDRKSTRLNSSHVANS